MRSSLKFLSVFTVIALTVASAGEAQTVAFPGALGFGSIATGGRNGTVYHVTTLADSGPGSFRDAVSSSGRTIVFDVGGYIALNSAVACKGNLTIAGQTAPGGGIGFKGGEISFAGQGNIIMRHVRIRPGSDTASSNDDALSLYQAKNAIFDHCSIEFAPWNNIDGVGDSTHVITNITFQNCIIANPTYQQFGCHSESVGGTWSWFYNVFANSHNRNPLAKVNTVFINNAEYNCSAGYTTHTSTKFKHDIVNNYFVYGPASGGNFPWYQIDNNQSIYFTGNLRDSDKNNTLNGSTTVPLPGYQGGGTILAAPWSIWVTNASVTLMSTALAWRNDLSLAGTLPRDDMDELVISQMKTLGNGTAGTGAGTAGPSGGLYTSQASTGLANNGYGTITGGATPLDSDRDGMPDYWEQATGSDPFGANSLTNTADGYTLLEHYINFLAVPHAITQTNVAVDIDLTQYTEGFAASATYTVSGGSNGVVTLTGSATAHFVPTANFVGIGSFKFTVNDGVAQTNVVQVLMTPISAPQDLLWRGDGSGNIWNTTNTLWFNGTNTATFRSGDTVTFDDTGSNAPFINIVGTVSPASITVTAAKNYLIGGSGVIAGVGSLTQSGTGALTISNANTFTGGVDIQGGVLNVGNGGALGSGTITLENATLNSLYNSTTTWTLSGAVSVPAGDTSTVKMSPRMTLTGLTGDGTLNLSVAGIYNVGSSVGYNNFNGTFSGFTGMLNATGTVANAMITANFNGGGFDGNLGSAAVNLSNVGIIGQDGSTGNTLNLGALSGDATSSLGGAGYAGPLTYSIGALNLDTIFAGIITNNVSTNKIVKVGSGTLTLSGNSIFAGATTVSAGTLRVNGSLSGNTVNVASGAKLSGSGSLLGGVAVSSGAISPGAGSGSVGTMTVSNNLTLATPTLYFDLSSSPSGANDKIVMQGGMLAMSGANTYVFNLTDGALGAGTYNLITGATNSTAWSSVTHNLPSGTRQTFGLNRTAAGANPAYTYLTVSGSPAATLIWQGTNGSAWDSSTTNWLNGAVADRFYNVDTVTFNDTSTNGTVTLTGALQPGAVLVTNNSLAYTLGGSGALIGSSPLTKAGSSTLNLTTTNSSYSGNILLTGGMLNMGGAGASLGSANISISGNATFNLPPTSPAYFFGGTITVPAGQTGTVTAPGLADGVTGKLISGSTNSVLCISSGVSFSGTDSSQFDGFTGTINILPNATLRYSPDSGGNTYGSLVPTFLINGTMRPRDAGNTVQLGALSGSGSLAGPQSNAGSGDTLYVIGGNNVNASFSGNISSNSAVAGSLVFMNKVGTGTFTLGGASTFTGGTTVSGGTLLVTNLTGSATGTGDMEILLGATLSGNGIIGSATTVDDFATFAPGNPTGTLTFTSDLTLNDNTALQFALGTNSDSVVVSGDLFLTGRLSVTNAGGFGIGAYTIFTCAGALTFDQLVLASAPAGYNYSFNTNTPGAVKLIVAPTTPPIFGNLTFSSKTNLVMSGSNGAPLGNYYVLSSTNLTLPLANWTRVATNQYDASGKFIFTNPISAASQNFYRLQQ